MSVFRIMRQKALRRQRMACFSSDAYAKSPQLTCGAVRRTVPDRRRLLVAGRGAHATGPSSSDRGIKPRLAG
jgi:hypothetical protein